MMNQFCLFSSGLELANLVVSSDLLHHSWDAISDLNKHTLSDNPTHPLTVKHKVYQYPPNVTIIAFVSSPDSTIHHLQNEVGDMVSSEELKGSFDLFDFVSTKVNPSVSIDKAAVTIFSSIQDELSLLKQQYGGLCPLIITGHSVGGSIASLFTLWLLDIVRPKDAKPPLCISFGSPFLGDNAFQRAISERPTWNSCFLHVVSDQDPIPRCFISSNNTLSSGSSSQTRVYKPFGTFLLCSETGCACLEEPESILEVMNVMSSNSVENQDPNKSFEIMDYGRVLDCLKYKAIRKATSQLAHFAINSRTQRQNLVKNPLQAEIILQLEAIGVKRLQQDQDNGAMNSLITNIGKRVENLSMRRRNMFDPTKKLNDMKTHMTYLEWYKKVTVDQGGYYDSYRRTNSRTRDEIKSREEIVKRKIILTQYWKRMVAEVSKMPQKEVAAFRTRWLFAGTNYRRMIESLDIAEYYMKGNRGYVTQGRSEHYVFLEQWLNEDTSAGHAKERNKACSLTEDSCFWAHVEEAIISCKVLKDGQSSPDSKESSKVNLIKFEQYVMDQIKNYAVSPEIFKPGSSFMQWWGEYYEIMGASYDSPLSDFMKNHHPEYA